MINTLIAMGAAAWAGVLALANMSRMTRHPLDEALEPGDVSVDQAIAVTRFALLIVAGVAVAEAVQWWTRPIGEAAISIALSAGLVYVVADGLPRGIGSVLPRTTDAAARVTRVSLVPFAPLFGLVRAAERGLMRLLPATVADGPRFGPAHHEMLRGAFSLGDTTVEEAMTPRIDIVAVETSASWRDLVEFLRRGDHARLPIYTSDLDNIIGVLFAKDVMPAASGITEPPERWQALVRRAHFVPESKLLSEQLRDFQRQPGGFAVVVDEFGGTAGIITLEDVVEEVVGEIYGEYDQDERPEIEREGADRFWVDGGVAVDDLTDLLGEPIVQEDVTTVAGLIYAELGGVPRPGQELRIGSFRVVVEQVVRRRIRRVYFERLTAPHTAPAGREVSR